MNSDKCKACGSSDLEVDPSRGDTVCTNCGTVLEDRIIVSEMQFEENARGVSSAIGQFVSSESSGAYRGFGSNFHAGASRESREITLQNARRSISSLCQQLRLNQHCLDTAFNFYKMALCRHLTRGRKHQHIIAACLYITCRMEGTPHLLIDFSDVLQICAFELGRTYLRLSQALCINVPALDPCMYVLRFASKLELGEKTHEVTMTALRLVQRMKRDSMHYGRRPSGICGAALLMASRLHQFNRTVSDIVKVVQVHETTLRKRLVEFGETPSSALTLQEFMTVDLQEEQDPPSYKAARAKDRDRLRLLEDQENMKELNLLQQEIEKHIFDKKVRKGSLLCDVQSTNDEEGDIENFVSSTTLDIIEDVEDEDEIAFGQEPQELGPSTAVMGLEDTPGGGSGTGPATAAGVSGAGGSSGSTGGELKFVYEEGSGELDTEGLDDEELDGYIMSEVETRRKDANWTHSNKDYLQKQKEKEEKLRKELEEGKPPPEKKKKKPANRKKNKTPANSAGEAIEKMLQEKKLSSKINYDVLKSLNFSLENNDQNLTNITLKGEIVPKEEVLAGGRLKDTSLKPLIVNSAEVKTDDSVLSKTLGEGGEMQETEHEDEVEEVDDTGLFDVSKLLNSHRNDEDYYGGDYEEEDY